MRRGWWTKLGIAVVLAGMVVLPAAAADLAVSVKGAVHQGGPLHLSITLPDTPAGSSAASGEEQAVRVLADGELVTTLRLPAGEHEVRVEAALAAGPHTVTVQAGGASAEATVRTLPGWLSVIPPLAAIVMALIFREVLISLLSGIFLGALFLTGGNPFSAFGRVIDHFIAPALSDPDNAKILIFSALLGAMVGVMSKSGGTRGIVDRLSPLATNPRRGQVATWVMGVLIFFDDYANTLIVGSTMRPITDRLRISREKLAYIVDSTAAPVASVMPISTWIGFEVGLIAASFSDLGLGYDPYVTFIASIPFRFYPILALVFGFTIAFTGRDLGPMLKAERRASGTGQVIADGEVALADYSSSALEPPDGIKHRALNAFLPIAVVILVTVWGLYSTGAAGLERTSFESTGAWLREVFANANSFDSLLWASFAGLLSAIALSVATRSLKLTQSIEGLVEGLKAMTMALVVLVLAWSIGDVCSELHTADYLVGLTQGVLAPHWLPVLVFALSAAVAFATGTSWATMSILIPLVIPILHALAQGAGHMPGSAQYTTLLLGTISSVLAGAVWGDHCSPISDTTILSSMGSGCNHIAHVRTQLPYALSVGVIGMLVGDIPTAFGLSPWLSILAGVAVIVGGVLWIGKRREG
ncbi:MAG: Na+/H+ antiporter NhaC family protein [Acidobacteria bacterium]|nr:Na+/H+ antiporter NhaC family protein [Acidobacteriota bacterium]